MKPLVLLLSGVLLLCYIFVVPDPLHPPAQPAAAQLLAVGEPTFLHRIWEDSYPGLIFGPEPGGGALPLWEQRMLQDPGWEQPWIPPRSEYAPSFPPLHLELQAPVSDAAATPPD